MAGFSCLVLCMTWALRHLSGVPLLDRLRPHLQKRLASKHRTFPPVFRFTPNFRIFRGKFFVVKSTLGHCKLSMVQNKNGVNSKIRRKNCKFMVLQSLRDKTIIFSENKKLWKISLICKKFKKFPHLSQHFSHFSQRFLNFPNFFHLLKGLA
jgi:hypothetical protein